MITKLSQIKPGDLFMLCGDHRGVSLCISNSRYELVFFGIAGYGGTRSSPIWSITININDDLLSKELIYELR